MRELADHLKVLFLDGDDEGVFIIPALDARSQILSIKDRRNGIGKPGISPEVLQRFSLKLTGLMCDGRSLASPLFRRLAGRGAFFCGFPFRSVLHFVVYLIRGVALHESSSCSGEDSLDDCGCPCDLLSCLLFSALWLRCSQSLLVQETQSAKDLDLTSCSTTFLFRDATCLPVPSLPPDVPRGVLPASIRSRWRQVALQAQPQILQRTAGWDGCGPFLSEGLRCITWNTRGLVGSVFSRQRNREFKLKYCKKTLGQQQHLLFPGSAWKGLVSSS